MPRKYVALLHAVNVMGTGYGRNESRHRDLISFMHQRLLLRVVMVFAIRESSTAVRARLEICDLLPAA